MTEAADDNRPPSATAAPLPPIVSAAEWEQAQAEVTAEELALNQARLDLGARRRRMPMTEVGDHYRFLAADGREVRLVDLFEGRRQLLTYKFFYAPDVGGWPDGACEGCSQFTDGVTHPAHLAARDVSMAWISTAPPERIATYQQRMGWDLPWYSEVGDDFSRDFGVSEWFAINVFLRDGDTVYRTAFSQGPQLEAVGSTWTLLEMTPYGRQEKTEDSPAGWPQSEPYAWYRRHDEYGTAVTPR